MPGEIWAVVVAAGAGERLAADRPKAFVRLGGRTMLAWSLAMLDDHDLIDGIVMVVPEEYEERASLLADDLCGDQDRRRRAGRRDAARLGRGRPGVRARGRRRSCSCTTPRGRWRRPRSSIASSRPCAPAPRGPCRRCRWPTRSSASAPDGSVAETLDRGALRAVQTPQGFPLAVLREALAERARRRHRLRVDGRATGPHRSSASRATSGRSRSRRRPTSPAPSSWPRRTDRGRTGRSGGLKSPA